MTITFKGLLSIHIIIVSFLFAGCIAKKEKEQNPFTEVVEHYTDSLFLPGLSVAVIHEGIVLFKASYGFSNLEYNIPMTDSSVYRIWSVSKQFCAISIMKLTEEKKLDIDDKTDAFLDSIPESWKKLTIRQLLNQTAGIKDYLNDYSYGHKLKGMPFKQVVDSTADLKFMPGDDWSYSNTNYWLLTKIIERVAGQTYQAYLTDNYFIPFRMQHTQKMDYKKIIPNRVNGYYVKNDTALNSSRYLDEKVLADGDAELISTLDDLVKWTLKFLTASIISKNSLGKAWTKAELKNGQTVSSSSIIFYDENVSYGLGWFIGELDGYKCVWTPGAGPGFSTTILTIPEKEVSVVVLVNRGKFLIADQIAMDLARTAINSK